MTYPEFVWFLLSEEDKKHPRRLLLLVTFRSAMHVIKMRETRYCNLVPHLMNENRYVPQCRFPTALQCRLTCTLP